MNDYEMMVDAYKEAGGEDVFSDSDTAHMVLEQDKVLGKHEVEGLIMEAEKIDDNTVDVKLRVKEGYKIKNPVHMCFGVLPREGLQKIIMDVEIEKDAEIKVMSDCVFPNATKVKHVMEADIHLAENSKYEYEENHFHGDTGGVEVIAKADIIMDEGSELFTLFTLRKGRVGKIDFDYESELAANTKVEMLTRISGYEDDKVKIREAAHLNGYNARGLLDSKIAMVDEAQAEVYNELTASAPEAKGHVDCTEIIKNNAVARAIPIVEVKHPEAKVTHEAAIGSVDSDQLQTLMARGLDEEEASDLIIQGLLKG
ncbi:MAG TPA: SufD family Fe-S cluster assembly protein [Halanaerobiales bacterium]|nr:SufD family Fe-S cluster assembly protein [Halanaerobiales bacterium]